MKYMGSKARLAKYILPIILDGNSKVYIEPFVGGANMIDKVPSTYERIGYDNNKYLIAMWTALQSGWIPDVYSREERNDVRDNKDNYADYIVRWCGFNLSYCGDWFKGYAGKVNTKEGIRDYQQEAMNNIKKQLPLLKGVKFICSDYHSIDIPDDSIVYCDPPYANIIHHLTTIISGNGLDYNLKNLRYTLANIKHLMISRNCGVNHCQVAYRLTASQVLINQV